MVISKMYKFFPERLQPVFNSPIRRATLESVMTGFLGQAVLLISGILVARVLGPEGRGYLAILVVFPVVLSQLGSIGLPQAATYFIAKKDDEVSEIYKVIKTAFFAQAFFLVIIHFIIVGLYVRHEPKEVVMAGYFTLAVIPGMLGQQYGLAILQGSQIYRLFNIMRLMPVTLYAAGILLIFWAGFASLPTITFTWVACNLIIGFLTFKLSLAKVPRLRAGKQIERSPIFLRMLKFGLKGLVGNISPFQNFRIDQLVAGLFLSPVALGIYVIGQAFTNLPPFIAQSAGIVVYPSVVASVSGRTAKRLIWRFLAAVSVLNGIIVLALIALIPILVPFFFGQAFSSSIPIARLLLVGAYFESLRRILIEGMRGLGRPEVSSWAEVSMYPFLCVFIPVFIGFYNLVGLSVAVTLGYLLSLIVAGVFLKVIS